jgi:hypothetical protein
VLASSNAGAAVNFTAGTKDISNDVPAAKQVTTEGGAMTGDLSFDNAGADGPGTVFTAAGFITYALDNLAGVFRIYRPGVGAYYEFTDNKFNILPGTASTSSSSGALVVAGGVGIGGALNVAAGATVNGGASVTGGGLLVQKGTAPPLGGHALALSFQGASNFGITFQPDVNDGYACYFVNAASAGIGSITCSATATAFNTSSDGNLKDDLKEPSEAIAIIDAIKVYNFRWIETDTRGIGAIAQELNEVEPRAVTPGGAVAPWSVDYSKLVPHLIFYVQQLQARIAALEARQS